MARAAGATPPTRTARQTPRAAARPTPRGPGRVRPVAILGVTADHDTASSLLLKAVQDDLGVVSPVVTVVSPNPVDPARLAQASIVGTSGQHLDVFEADASAGAGGSSVGVAGAVALNPAGAQRPAPLTAPA